MMRTHIAAVVCLACLAASCSTPLGGPGRGNPNRGRDLVLPRERETIEARVPQNATFETILRQQQMPATVTSSLVDEIRKVFNPKELRANQPYRVVKSLDGLIREFQYDIDADRFLRVVLHKTDPGAAPAFDVNVEAYPKTVEIDAATADISKAHPSLIGALDVAGENVQLALALADVFGGEVDFNADLRQGDHVEALFERVKRDGEFAGYGSLNAAVIRNEGRTITAIRYPGPDGKPGWYDANGKSLKRQFLRSPLRFDPSPQVTSGFTYRRLHPIYGDVREHLGVDYAAGYGAPVVAIATGTVEIAGMNGDAGRMVQLRHTGGYESVYMHLSAFAPGISPGARVEQGQLIGRVGASGAATGPHLDFRIKKNGSYVNPLIEQRRTPQGDPIAASAMEAFTRERDRAMAELAAKLARAKTQ
jgi:murein DD-endopeptidase MepM/ murein hydrolase activator NlpD